MLVADARSGVQVAAAEGSSKKADLKVGAALFGSSAAGALGGYTKTNEGKVIAASLMDNYNNIVKSVRGQPSLQRDVRTLAEEAGKKTKGGAVFNEGDTIVPKIGNLKVYSSASDSSKTVATLGKGEVGVVFTSGGPISWAAAQLLAAGAEQWGRLNPVQVNTGFSRLVTGSRGVTLVSLNEQAHLTSETLTYR